MQCGHWNTMVPSTSSYRVEFPSLEILHSLVESFGWVLLVRWPHREVGVVQCWMHIKWQHTLHNFRVHNKECRKTDELGSSWQRMHTRTDGETFIIHPCNPKRWLRKLVSHWSFSYKSLFKAKPVYSDTDKQYELTRRIKTSYKTRCYGTTTYTKMQPNLLLNKSGNVRTA